MLDTNSGSQTNRPDISDFDAMIFLSCAISMRMH